MPKFKALYYPTFEPPTEWLRSFLLFYDEINTIVPKDVSFTLSGEASKVIEFMPDAFNTISPKEEDISIDTVNLTRLRKAFKAIAQKKPKSRKNQIVIEIEDGSVRIRDH